MAEKEKENKKKAAAAAVVVAETVSETPAEHLRKEEKKSRWTIETCQHAARRFTTREEWRLNAPSSFKAASAKGWDIQCCAHMAPSQKPAASKVAASKSPAKGIVKKSA
jgi:hypothetical protein